MLARTLRALAALVILTGASAALAHEEENGPHGGHIKESAGHHIEFVAAEQDLTFYLSDEKGAPLAAKGSTGKAIIQQDGKTQQVELAVVDPDKLTAKLETPLVKGAKIAVTATMADGHNLQALFVAP